jgi:radical SAM protein with 4Fe4S-binding SPASM domain
MNILWSPSFSDDRYFKSEEGSRHFVGSRCSANFSHMVSMPDGKVTLCEQLYWNPRFIIGDLSTQSIEEVWNSPRALELAFPKKSNFRDDSVCKKCSIFDTCYTTHNKCYADVLKAYGDENWDYPDPRCVYAPPFIHDLLIH